MSNLEARTRAAIESVRGIRRRERQKERAVARWLRILVADRMDLIAELSPVSDEGPEFYLETPDGTQLVVRVEVL